MKLRCLTVRQPWAHAIVHGCKRWENRTWAPKYRGLLLIHAGTADRDHYARFEEIDLPDGTKIPTADLRYGAIIGAVRFTDVRGEVEAIQLSRSDREKAFVEGPQCWRFDEPVVFDSPVVVKGKLNLFEVESSILSAQDLAKIVTA